LFRLSGSHKVDTVHTHVYDTYKDPKSGVSLEITNFRPFNVQNFAGPGEPKKFHDLGPAFVYIVRGPGLKPVKIKSFMNPLILNGQNQGTLLMVSASGDGKDYQPFELGLDLSDPKEWQLFQAFVAIANKNGLTKPSQQQMFADFRSAMQKVYGDKMPPNVQQLGARLVQAMKALPNIPWPYIPVLDNYKQLYYTGLQLTEDPGMKIVWTGSGLLVLGLCVMLYMPHRKLWLVMRKAENGYEVSLGGMTNRNRLNFDKEFKNIVAKLNETFT